MPVITVSRLSGSYGEAIAETVAQRLGYRLVTREILLEEIFRPHVTNHDMRMLAESPRYFFEEFTPNRTYKDHMQDELIRLTQTTSMVLIGIGGCHFLSDQPGCIHIRVQGSPATRAARLAKRHRMEMDGAESYIAHWDRKYQRFISTLFKEDSNNSYLYHTVFNTDHVAPDACIDAIVAIVADYEAREQLLKITPNSQETFIMDDLPDLKHSSEIEFARMLDRYRVDWRYEPKSFPVEWDEAGNVITAFRPDFYLPKFDLYLELTTMDQKYVARKNRKARLAKEQYGIDVKIVYRRDYKAVIEHSELDVTEQQTLAPQPREHIPTSIVEAEKLTAITTPISETGESK